MSNDLAINPASELQTTPKCSLFGTCGGCSYQNLAYEDQLHLKRSLVVEALSEFHPDIELIVRPTLPSPKPYGYRHMIALSVKRRQGKLHMGFMGQDRRSFLPIESCPISDERINQFLPSALQKLEELPPERKFNTSQIVIRVGTDGEVVTSIRSDRGKHLECEVLGRRFLFAMSSFFQNNFSILESFMNAIQEFLDPKGNGTLFDLYSGVGLIGILMAEHYESVIGIEEGYEAVKFAQENAVKNRVTNVSFLEGKVENLLAELTKKSKDPLHVIVDPPRIGLKPEVIHYLMNLSIERLVYVSCSLEALKRDLGILTDHYEIKEVQPLDFFPQTKHIETLVLMKPRD